MFREQAFIVNVTYKIKNKNEEQIEMVVVPADFIVDILSNCFFPGEYGKNRIAKRLAFDG
jgi:hypothetical protein